MSVVNHPACASCGKTNKGRYSKEYEAFICDDCRAFYRMGKAV